MNNAKPSRLLRELTHDEQLAISSVLFTDANIEALAGAGIDMYNLVLPEYIVVST